MVMTTDLASQLLDVASCSILAAKTKCQTDRQRNRNNDSREQSLYKCGCNLELCKCSKDGENPYCPLCDGAGKTGARDAACFRCAGYDILCNFRNDCTNQYH